jgi:hypothetical protein
LPQDGHEPKHRETSVAANTLITKEVTYMGSTLSSLRAAPVAAVAVLAALALLAAPSARSDQLPPLVELAPITVANGTAVVAGTVGGPTAGSTAVSVDGQPLAVDASGHFTGTVSLNGASALNLSLRDPITGETTVLDPGSGRRRRDSASGRLRVSSRP